VRDLDARLDSQGMFDHIFIDEFQDTVGLGGDRALGIA